MENREPIFHDRQTAFSTTDQSTDSDVFVDIEGATLETGDLGQPSNYSFWFTLIVSASVANTEASFRLLINGVPFTPMGRQLDIKTSNQDLAVTFLGLLTDVEAGDILQVQWLTDKGTLTLEEFDMMIDGIPEIRVIAAPVSVTVDSYLLEDGFALLKEDSDFLLIE